MISSVPEPNDERSYAEPRYAHELRVKRINLEIEQSLYFLEENRVEDKINKKSKTRDHCLDLNINYLY